MPCKKCQQCGAKQPKGTRQPNSWNMYVKQAMQTPEIQNIPNPTDKMKAVAAMWKSRAT